MRKYLSYIIGGWFAVISLCGLLVLAVPSGGFSMTVAIVLLCLTVAYGMLTLDLSSLFGLAIGVCMLVFPSWIAGMLLMLVGAGGAALNATVGRKFLLQK